MIMGWLGDTTDGRNERQLVRLGELQWVMHRTCWACPEQYDVFLTNFRHYSYFRLRHGGFTVQGGVPPGSRLVYESSPEGDGIFEPHERWPHFAKAFQALAEGVVAALDHKKPLKT